MIEIALCLAIVGFALVSILLVLPSGMNTQTETRQETIINQDASVLLEAIRNGARGMDDLTNNVYAITNYWTDYNPNGSVKNKGINGYSYVTASTNGTAQPFYSLTNGARIVGLMSIPELTDESGVPIPGLNFGGISNHVVAYVRSLSGLAVEKPPQNNQIMTEGTFSYRVLLVNAPIAMDTNLFYLQPLWQSRSYNPGDQVFWRWVYWRAIASTVATDVPGASVPSALIKWVKMPVYELELAHSQHELRMLFSWPLRPNGSVGEFRQSFRTSIAGQLVQTNDPASNMGLYLYQPEIFSSAP